MTDNTQPEAPEALRLANVCSNLTRYSMDAHLIAAELCRLHYENERLAALVDAQQPTPSAALAEQQMVAYLDIGAGGYIDLGSELPDEALLRLPKGRHALVIAGTFGIDGYVAAAPQPSPTPQADSVLEDAALDADAIDRIVLEHIGKISSLGEGNPVAKLNYYRDLVRAGFDAARKQGGA